MRCRSSYNHDTDYVVVFTHMLILRVYLSHRISWSPSYLNELQQLNSLIPIGGSEWTLKNEGVLFPNILSEQRVETFKNERI